jgi:hypothetical protein
MNFLAPVFFLGLATIAVPIIVHLIQRERKHVQFFPSLMFVQKIPYQSVRRRRIRHWGLLLMRAAAIALLVAAFARPFLPQGAAALAAAGGNRELVILLDNSASMGYADHFDRAREAAHSAIASIGPTDSATLVLFAENAEEHIRGTSDRGRLDVAVNAAKVTAGATRYGPALKLAESILARSGMQRREAILISDFQKTGWTGADRSVKDDFGGNQIFQRGQMRINVVAICNVEGDSNLESVAGSNNFSRAFKFHAQEFSACSKKVVARSFLIKSL